MASLEECVLCLRSGYDDVLEKLDEVFNTFEKNKLYEYGNKYFIKIENEIYVSDDPELDRGFLKFSEDPSIFLDLIGVTKLPKKDLTCHLSFPDGLEDGKKYTNSDGKKIIFKNKQLFVLFLDENGEAVDFLSYSNKIEFKLIEDKTVKIVELLESLLETMKK